MRTEIGFYELRGSTPYVVISNLVEKNIEMEARSNNYNGT